MYRHLEIFIPQLPGSRIHAYTRYLSFSDMELLESDTSDHCFRKCAKSKGDVKTEKCSVSPIEDPSTDLHTSFFTWSISCLKLILLQKKKPPTR